MARTCAVAEQSHKSAPSIADKPGYDTRINNVTNWYKWQVLMYYNRGMLPKLRHAGWWAKRKPAGRLVWVCVRCLQMNAKLGKFWI